MTHLYFGVGEHGQDLEVVHTNGQERDVDVLAVQQPAADTDGHLNTNQHGGV